MPRDQSQQDRNKKHIRRNRSHASFPASRERHSAFPNRHRFIKQHRERHSPPPQDVHDLMQPEHTGSEAAYMKSLIDSRAVVTVVLMDGARLQGRIRYYDCDCFSIGLSATGPRIFLRKDSVAYISEERQ